MFYMPISTHENHLDFSWKKIYIKNKEIVILDGK